MRTYNLTALALLSFIANTGYGMDDTGGAAFFSEALPTSAVKRETTEKQTTDLTATPAPCGGAGMDVRAAGTGSTGEEGKAETLLRTEDDARMEKLGVDAKTLISLRETMISKLFETVMRHQWLSERTIKTDLKRLPTNFFKRPFDKTESGALQFSDPLYQDLSPRFQGFYLMDDDAVDDEIAQARAIRDRASLDLSLPTLLDKPFEITKKRKEKQTTLILGCGRDKGEYGACPNHVGTTNKTHYTVDVDPTKKPELLGSYFDQRVWDALGENVFDEIIMEAVVPYTDIRLMKAAFKALRPDGVLRLMHVLPNIFLDETLKPSIDVPLFSSFQNFTKKSLLDLSLRDYLTQVIGFERAEIYRVDDTKVSDKKGDSLWRAFKAVGDRSSSRSKKK